MIEDQTNRWIQDLVDPKYFTFLMWSFIFMERPVLVSHKCVLDFERLLGIAVTYE